MEKLLPARSMFIIPTCIASVSMFIFVLASTLNQINTCSEGPLILSRPRTLCNIQMMTQLLFFKELSTNIGPETKVGLVSLNDKSSGWGRRSVDKLVEIKI